MFTHQYKLNHIHTSNHTQFTKSQYLLEILQLSHFYFQHFIVICQHHKTIKNIFLIHYFDSNKTNKNIMSQIIYFLTKHYIDISLASVSVCFYVVKVHAQCVCVSVCECYVKVLCHYFLSC